ncbi:uncharacterized protein LOC110713506 [Chenopodium quinoa]|uniref:uncharacterized protein LOC110713506 n=1 Tax=Chenopodium quinoa TaxID=63459 RepID=UPI000B77055E|nr:uncharacterized protein LOC110713506 [Chenopodium quinoa]
MPLKVLNHETPFSKLYMKQANLTHLRTFGCLCYVSTSKVGRTKLDSRAKPCVFLGYSSSQKGYKVLDLETYKMFVSRDIHFHEKHFPFHLYNKKSSPTLNYSNAIYLPVSSSPTIFPDTPNIPYFPSHDSTPPQSFQSDSSSPNDSSTSTNSHPSHNSSPTNSHTDLPPILPVPFSDLNSLIDLSSSHIDQTRKSSRPHKAPSYLDKYLCYHVDSTHVHTNCERHWCNFVSYQGYPSSFKAFLSHFCDIKEPLNYHEASQDPLWIEAMNKKILALE